MNAPLQRTRHEFSRKHNITFVRSSIRFLFPGVYAMWLADGTALYIGSSRDAWRRANKKESHPTRDKALAEADFIEIYPCESAKQARHLEVELIGIYKPKYNRLSVWLYSRSFQQIQAEHEKLFAGAQP